MSVISITNHKGGVGKTTSTLNIGAGLSKKGKRVLLVDMDPQANLSLSLGITEPAQTIYGAIKGEYRISPIEIYPGLDILPSTLDLSGAEIELSSETGREYILREILAPYRDQYEYILIDCPPSLGLLTINALTASDRIFIPLQAEYLSLRGLAKLMEIVDKVKKRLNGDLEIGGVFITQYDGRKTLNRNIVESIEKHFPDKVFSTKLRDNVALAEAPSAGQDIFRYNPKSFGAQDYASLCEEILNNHKGKTNE